MKIKLCINILFPKSGIPTTMILDNFLYPLTDGQKASPKLQCAIFNKDTRKYKLYVFTAENLEFFFKKSISVAYLTQSVL